LAISAGVRFASRLPNTSYSMIQLASDSGNAAAVVLFLFDLLYLDGADLLPRPLNPIPPGY